MGRLRERRALSAIVSGAILLTATVVMGTGLVSWSNSNLKVFEAALVSTSSNMTNQINENLSIEKIVFCVNCNGVSKQNVINVTMTNTGTIPVKVIKLQVNSTIINSYYASTANLPATILPKQSYLVSANLASPLGSWKSGITDTITVTTSRNSIYTIQAVPP